MSTRDRLVGTMAVSLRERGLSSSSMKELLSRAEVTAGSMYHFFPEGKEQLAAVTMREVGEIVNDRLRETLEEAESVAEGTRVFFEMLVVEMEESDFSLGCPIGVPATEAAGSIPMIREAGADVFRMWIETVAARLEVEGWSSDDALQAARFWVAAYEGASTLARTSRDSSIIRDTLSAVLLVLR